MLVRAETRPTDLVIRGARVLDPAAGLDAVTDIRVDAGTITQLGDRLDANGHRVVEAEGLVLDAAGHRVTVGDRTVQLGPTEYRLLSFFMTHAERVYSRAQLLDRVWGGNVYVEERTVDVHIRRLRKALEAFNYDRFIQTVRGSGYRFSTRAE